MPCELAQTLRIGALQELGSIASGKPGNDILVRQCVLCSGHVLIYLCLTVVMTGLFIPMAPDRS